MAEKASEKEIERLYVIPLRKVKWGRSSLATPRAVKHVRNFLTKHMKVDAENIWIDDSLNRALWAHGKYRIPSKIRVRATKFEDGVVEATLPEIGLKKSRRELLKEEKEKKTPILRREVAEETGETAGVAGAEDYEIAPTADGDVKIKKKKEKEPKKEEPAKEKKEKPKKSEKKTAKKEDKEDKGEKGSEKPKKKTAASKETKKKTTEKKEKVEQKKKEPSKKTNKKSE